MNLSLGRAKSWAGFVLRAWVGAIGVAGGVGAAGVGAGVQAAERPLGFNADIRPILAEACFHCHGPDPGSRKAGLRLDREEGFFGGGKTAAVLKGDPGKSPLYQRLISTDPDEVMPPPEMHRQLKPEEKKKIELWIAQGASWEPHWSFIAPKRPELPAVKNAAWTRTPVDRFVLAKLEAAGLSPAPEADRQTLARRVSLDLTGLPPEPALVKQFVEDRAPDAYEKLVDHLMQQPQYGEHRARYWLDAARYADTHGLHFDNYREMWAYRDWVIGAFNRNLPFDQFTIEQLAGDLLPQATQDQIIATGFHRCNITTNEGGTIPDENLAMYARDRVETTSWVWLGLTANCASCHDHKFDPVSMKDFYSMAAFFRNTTQGAMDGNVRDTKPVLVLPRGEDEKRWAELPEIIAQARRAVDDRKKHLRPEFDRWLAEGDLAAWEKDLETVGAPEFRLPLTGVEESGRVSGVFRGQPVAATSAEPLEWAGEGPFGRSAAMRGGRTLELPGQIGDFEKDQPFTVGCWVKVPREGTGAVLAKMDDTAGYRGWDLWVQDNEFGSHLIHQWDSDAIKVLTTGNQVKRDTWQRVQVSYDGSGKAEGFRIHVDGRQAKLRFEKNQLKSTTRTDTPLRIGQRKTGSVLTGVQVQEVRIDDRVLGAKETQLLASVRTVRQWFALSAEERQKKDKKERDALFVIWSGLDADLASGEEALAALEAEQKTIRDRSPVTHIMEEKRDSMPVAHILLRGEYDKLGEKVEGNVFASLHPLPEGAPRNRLGLAQWLVSPENPLTPRVIANRYWQELFGTGLVASAEDFGIMGETPSHPELLDWLAVEFREQGWDVKKLLRLLVTSAAYRQAPVTTADKLARDPGNRLISRGPRFRMDAEMIRDYALAASGLLSAKIGGPSVRPYQPPGVWEVVGMPGSDTRDYRQDKGESLYRRSLYTFWKRMAPPASMEVLNAPNREVSCVRRERTNTPLQALVTLNDPQFVEAARILAQKAMQAAADEGARLDEMARRVLVRPLLPGEKTVLLEIHRELLAHYRQQGDEARRLLKVGEAPVAEGLDEPELAAWTMVGNQLLNLDEVLNK